MAKKLAIVVTHGMGTQERSFANPMIGELNDWVDDLGKDPNLIAWRSIYWADILIPQQRKYFQDAKRKGDLDYNFFRQFIINALGDATAYQQVKSSANTTYEDIHTRVAIGITRLNDATKNPNGSNSTPQIIIAHSLGGHIMSNYIWDMQKGHTTGSNGFERMETLAGFVTFGCNIPLFTFAYSKVVPIDFPAKQLPPSTKNKARWLNFYDPDDILGYPLRPINAAYKNVVSEDKAINVGGFLTSWNPASHGKYWTDNDFTKPVSRFIASFL